MAKPIQIEIELQSATAKEDIYELRNYLQENFDGVSLHIKEAPPQEGQMGSGVLGEVLGILVDPVVGGIVEAVVGLTIHQVYDRNLKPKLDAWIKSKRKFEPWCVIHIKAG